jgi:hypothetical protein
VFVLRRGLSQMFISMTPSKCWILLKSWETLDGCDSLWSWCEYSQGSWFGSSYDISNGH